MNILKNTCHRCHRDRSDSEFGSEGEDATGLHMTLTLTTDSITTCGTLSGDVILLRRSDQSRDRRDRSNTIRALIHLSLSLSLSLTKI